MSDLKKYRVLDNSCTRCHGVRVGDICYLSDHEPFGTNDWSAWFYNENWDDDCVWCLKRFDVCNKLIIEEQKNEMSKDDFILKTGNGMFPYFGAIGGNYKYSFTPNSIGVLS